jgi:putative serine protease PepD
MNRPGTRTFRLPRRRARGGAPGGAAIYAAAAGGGSAVATATPAAAAAQPAANTTKALTINQIYKRDSLGVVEITVTSAGSSNGYPFGGGTSTAQGSGFVYDKAGHIVTNQHVVDGATTARSGSPTARPTAPPSSARTRRPIWRLLKIDAPGVSAPSGRASRLSAVEVGDAVVAIGSPFGLEETITAGIVSALNRQIQATNGFTIGGGRSRPTRRSTTATPAARSST